jgi:hypothetical protein
MSEQYVTLAPVSNVLSFSYVLLSTSLILFFIISLSISWGQLHSSYKLLIGLQICIFDRQCVCFHIWL